LGDFELKRRLGLAAYSQRDNTSQAASKASRRASTRVGPQEGQCETKLNAFERLTGHDRLGDPRARLGPGAQQRRDPPLLSLVAYARQGQIIRATEPAARRCFEQRDALLL